VNDLLDRISIDENSFVQLTIDAEKKMGQLPFAHFERSIEAYTVEDGISRRHRSNCASFREVMIFSHRIFQSLRDHSAIRTLALERYKRFEKEVSRLQRDREYVRESLKVLLLWFSLNRKKQRLLVCEKFSE